MLNVAVAEIGLPGAGVVSLICQCVAASMPKHVRVRLEGQLGLPPRPFNHAGEASGAERRSPFRGEHEGRLGPLFALEPPQRPKLVPEDWVGARSACPA